MLASSQALHGNVLQVNVDGRGRTVYPGPRYISEIFPSIA